MHTYIHTYIHVVVVVIVVVVVVVKVAAVVLLMRLLLYLGVFYQYCVTMYHVVFPISEMNQACEWTMCSGGSRKTQLNCNESLIFVENVSTYWGAPDRLAFRNIRQMCLGAKRCDISRMCQGTTNQFSRIRYVCVNGKHGICNHFLYIRPL